LNALEPRLAAAAPSCYITSWEKLWYEPGPQDAEQNFHGFISSGLDFSDFLTAWAPRPVSMMVAIQDFFPIEGARATYREAADLFEVLRARPNAGYFEYDDKHGWTQPRREATYRWFEKWLKGRETDGAEAPSKVEKPADLYATSTGQLATSAGSETVASLNRKLAEKMYPRRAAAHGAGLAELVRKRLVVTPPSGTVKLREKTAGPSGSEKLLLETEHGITIEVLAFAKSGQTDTAVILDPEPALPPPAASELNTVFLLVRGWGGNAPPPDKRLGYSASYQTFMRAFLVGKTIAGMQVTDALRAIEYLRAHGMNIVSLEGRGRGGPLALYTGILDPAIARVITDGKAPSFLEICRMREHTGLLDQFVPGVLHDFDLPDLIRALDTRHAQHR
jgi:hypothetical protein